MNNYKRRSIITNTNIHMNITQYIQICTTTICDLNNNVTYYKELFVIDNGQSSICRFGILVLIFDRELGTGPTLERRLT